MRAYPTGWAEPGFAEDGRWAAAAVQPAFYRPLALKQRPIALFARRATSVVPLASGAPLTPSAVLRVDFGRELQGGANLTVLGTAGANITVWLSESLLDNGVVKFPMFTGTTYKNTYTLRDGRQSISNHEYMEFRWGLIEGLSASCAGPERPCLVSADAWVCRTPMSDALADQYGDVPALPPSTLRRPSAMTAFTSGNADLNSVWNLTRHTGPRGRLA